MFASAQVCCGVYAECWCFVFRVVEACVVQGGPDQISLLERHKMPPNWLSNHMLSEFANCIHTAGQNSIPGTFDELAELVAFQAVGQELCSFNLYSPATGVAKTNREQSKPGVSKLCPGGPLSGRVSLQPAPSDLPATHSFRCVSLCLDPNSAGQGTSRIELGRHCSKPTARLKSNLTREMFRQACVGSEAPFCA